MATSPHLKALGLTAQDLQNYRSSQWLVSLGRGAFKRPMETVTWQGALYSVQSQLKLPVHEGALTAIEMTGNRHYVRFGESRAYLFSPQPEVQPAGFQQHGGGEVRHRQTKLLPNDIGLTEHRTPEGYPLTAATPERAILELLHLAPKEFDLVEACQIVEGMTSLRPKLMQSLLEACTSVKVRRLFLYLAERADLPVMRHVKVEQIDLGSGDRSLAKMGRYVPKYRLLLPRELVSSGN